MAGGGQSVASVADGWPAGVGDRRRSDSRVLQEIALLQEIIILYTDLVKSIGLKDFLNHEENL